MKLRSRRSPISTTLPVLAATALAVLGALALAHGVCAEGKPAGQVVTVMVSGQGTPVPDVKVTLAPDPGINPESWNVGTSTPLATVATDATGHAVFPDVPPARYIVTTGCSLPGNWIAGNYATKVEVLAGRSSAVTLTLRRGGMIQGKALRGAAPAPHVEIRTDSPDALMSSCGMMTPTVVDSASGRFTVTKIPLNASTWVKGEMPLGPGRLGVWKEFRFEKADTVDCTLAFPEMGPKDVGSLLINFVPDGTEKPDSGSAQLLQVTSDGKWRYEATVDVGGTRPPHTITNLPTGPYQLRAFATPGSNKWWNAPIDTLSVRPGATTKYTLKVSTR